MDLKNDGQPTKSITDKEIADDRLTDGITRRKALKTSAFALGACYLAPSTLDLLLASRATAQSDLPQVGGEGQRVGCVCNFSISAVRVTYMKVDSITCDEDVPFYGEEVQETYEVDPGSLPGDCDICCLKQSEVIVQTLGDINVDFKVTPIDEEVDQQISSIMAGQMLFSDFSGQIIEECCGKIFSFRITEDVKILVQDLHDECSNPC